MVHALEEIKRLLEPGGHLIDIHPTRAGLIRVQQGNDLLFAKLDPGYDTDGSLQRADEALEQVLRRGLYLVKGTDEFEVVTYASSAAELKAYWETYEAYNVEPKDEAIIRQQDEVYARAKEIMRNAPGAEITYQEWVRITRLKPLEG